MAYGFDPVATQQQIKYLADEIEKLRSQETRCNHEHQPDAWSAGYSAGQQAAADHVYDKASHVCGYSYCCEDCLRHSIAAALRATGGETT